MTAATTGGESEYASRSTVNVAIVAGTSASRSGAIRSTAWHFTHTRCGGKCRAPHAWQRLPVNANFHASARAAGGASGGWGSRSEEHTSELQSQSNLVCRLLLEKKKKKVQRKKQMRRDVETDKRL